MTSYTDVFGEGAVPLSRNSFIALTISTNTTLVWNDLASAGSPTVADILHVTASVGSLVLTLPPANEASVGSSLLVRNVGSESFSIQNNSGGAVTTLAVGEVKFIYLTANSTVAGTWSVTSFGAGTSSADSSALAGYGLLAVGSTLAQSMPVTELSVGVSITGSDRAKMLVFTGGSATVNLPAVSGVSGGFFFGVRNSGTGTVTIDGASAETIDGLATLALSPGESAIVVASVDEWFTVGYGRSNQFLYSKLTKSVAGGSNVTLTASESANQVMEFTGLLTGNINVIVPAVNAVYYVQNSTTGAFTLTVKTNAGTGIVVQQSRRAILLCDAVNVYLAQDSGTALVGTLGDGSAGAPSLTFSSDPNTGFFRKGEDSIGFSAGGIERAALSDVSLETAVPVRIPAGTVSAPGLSFAAETNSGLYRVGATEVGLTVNSTQVFSATPTALKVKDTILTVQDDADTTKQLKFQASGITTGTTRTLASPNHDGKIATDVPHLGHPVNARLVISGSGTLGAGVLRGEGAGSTPTVADPISVAMRSGTGLGVQTLVTRYITASCALTISSGATMGHQAAVPQSLYWYLIDNAGTIELAASATYFGISGVVSTTAMSAAADSATVMYSTSARTNAPFILFARTVHTEASPGTWNSDPSEIYYAPFDLDRPATTPFSGLRNKIIGGDFTTNPWQRGTTFTALTSGGYGADRWLVAHVTDGVVDILKTADAPTAAQAAHYTIHCLHADVTTADASLSAAQSYGITQLVEGYNAASFGFGQAGTRYVTLSFWVKSTKTGTFCCSLRNSTSTRAYVKEYTVSVTDTWEKKILTFPVDTSGTWLYDTGIGLRVSWSIGSGTDYHTTADTWAAGNYLATSNQVNALDSTSNNFKLALVQLEAGTVATPFEARDVGTELALCQRYLPAFNSPSSGNTPISTGQCISTTEAKVFYEFRVRPRVPPTGISISNATHFGVTAAAGGPTALTGLTFGALAATEKAADLDCTVTAGLVAGNATQLYSSNASAQILFTGAEF